MKSLLLRVGVLLVVVGAMVGFGPQLVQDGAKASDAAPLARIVSPASSVPRPPGFQNLLESRSGSQFVPRGMNYINLSRASTGSYFHSSFEPGKYNEAHAEAFLQQMQRSRYNVVRVFIDPGSLADAAAGEPHGMGRGMGDYEKINAAYMDVFADFVRRATRQGVYVLPTLDLFPQNAHYYRNIVGPIDVDKANVEGSNLTFMHIGHIRAKKAYLAAFIAELEARVGTSRLSTLLAIQLANEPSYFTTLRPFNRMSGEFRGADGVSYDMSDPMRRQQAADSHAVVFVGQMVDAIRAADPDMMVTVGVTSNLAMGRAGLDGLTTHCTENCSSTDRRYRYPLRASALALYSRISFLDVHLYPRATVPYTGQPWTLEAALTSMEWSKLRGVVVLGEFGAYRSVYRDITQAAYAMRDFESQMCLRGAGGFLFWAWETTGSPDQQQLFSASEMGGAVNGVLAPVVRPDPCRI